MAVSRNQTEGYISLDDIPIIIIRNEPQQLDGLHEFNSYMFTGFLREIWSSPGSRTQCTGIAYKTLQKSSYVTR